MMLANRNQHASLLSILIAFTLIAIAAQIIFFIIHYKVSDLLDSLVQSSLKAQILHPVVLIPLIGFLLTQVVSYSVFIAWIWFISISISTLFQLSPRKQFWLALLVWTLHCGVILSLNNYFYPDSFFARLLPTHDNLILFLAPPTLILIILAYVNFFRCKKHVIVGSLFIILGMLFSGFAFYTSQESRAMALAQPSQKANIIFIGLDSLRPDFTGYFAGASITTPNIDAFLKSANIFTHAYTPLARTFPAWMSILTAKYPKNSNARTNLADPSLIHADETLAKRLQAEGYETIYGTDEKRFSNITKQYGFDHIIGPKMGVNDFILGGLSDFPLTNLLVNSSLGRVLFPFNYANRAAAITYEPDTFLNLVKLDLAQRTKKPLFLAIHLCVSHWPYTWARDKQARDATSAERYKSSVEEVDAQLGELLGILKSNGLLENSMVILLSDHGTTAGLPHDRVITEENYRGAANKIHWIPFFKLGTAKDFSTNIKHDFRIDTSYGQGTDVLSLKQYHVVLAFKGFGLNIPHKENRERASLMDIAPTVLDFLHLKPMNHIDGISLYPSFDKSVINNDISRPLFLETGYTISDITTKDIFVEKVVQHSIGAYAINPHTGLLYVKQEAEKSVNQNKQRALLTGDWLLVRYPPTVRSKLAPTSHHHLTLESYTLPPFFVIANLKSHEWGIGLDSPIAQKAPLKELMKKFNSFYGDEL